MPQIPGFKHFASISKKRQQQKCSQFPIIPHTSATTTPSAACCPNHQAILKKTF
jgi:hypothetical protein